MLSNLANNEYRGTNTKSQTWTNVRIPFIDNVVKLKIVIYSGDPMEINEDE